MIHPVLDRWGQGWRGPLLAAVVALLAGIPSLFTLPPLDRDESRFAQASAQMLETGDIVSIKLQDQPRDKKPVGIYWLQALSTDVLSSAEARQIWSYRLPSLLGAMLAAAACAWGAGAVFPARAATAAGVILGATFLLSTEAAIAKTDAAQMGCITLMMAAFARIYAASRGGPDAGWRTRLLFWLGLAGASLIKGPVALLVALFAGSALWIWDRKAPWLRRMGWGWGLVILVAVIGPWAAAITIATDGGFWSAAVGGDLAPKLAGGHESHGAPPGYHLLLSPLLLFPAGLLIPAALAYGWRNRGETGVRFAIVWLVPTWLMFELLPTKLAHYTLPAFGAFAWLAAAALTQPINRSAKWIGVGLMAFAAILFAVLAVYAAVEYGQGSDLVLGAVAAVLFLAAGAAGAWALVRNGGRALAATLVLGILAHGWLAGVLAPRLEALWLSQRVARAVRGEGLDPRNGVTPGPVAIAGYGEPSLVFALGTATDLTDASGAADAIAEGRPAVVEQRLDKDFRTALAMRGLNARAAAVVSGVNYSDGDDERLVIWQAVQPPPRQARGQRSRGAR